MRRSQIHQKIAERGIAIYGERASEIAAELAMHFEQSRDWPRALEFLLQAAENAMARSAHHEAIDLGSRGLEALKSLSDPAEYAKQEMKLRMILTVSLMAVQGFASAEAEEVNANGRELFWRHGPSPELFYMLWTLNLYRQFRGEMNSSLEVSSQLMKLAEDLKDDVLIVQGHRALAAALVFLGRCGEALEHIDKGTALCTARQDKCYSVFVVLDTEVMFECFAALALLDLGYADQAAKKLATGLALARKDRHPQTLVVALDVAAQFHQLRGEPSLVLVYAREAMELADEYGFAVWRAHGLMALGWAEAELEDPQAGIKKMRRGLAAYDATGAKLRSPYFMGLLADQLGKTGQIDDALSVIADAIALAQNTGETYGLPELHLIKGELPLKSGDPGDPSTLSEARACFGESLTIAKKQRAGWRLLRAALSLDRLKMSQGNFDHKELAKIYSSFHEGLETADLKQARAQLSATSAK
jgi:tetratricopeptide (TPR) repeat protein